MQLYVGILIDSAKNLTTFFGIPSGHIRDFAVLNAPNGALTTAKNIRNPEGKRVKRGIK
jgi:hypothetical protein